MFFSLQYRVKKDCLSEVTNLKMLIDVNFSV